MPESTPERPPIDHYRLLMILESARDDDCTNFPPEVVEELCEAAIYWQEKAITNDQAYHCLLDLEYEPTARDYAIGAARGVRSALGKIAEAIRG